MTLKSERPTFNDGDSTIQVYAEHSSVMLYAICDDDENEVALLVTPEVAEQIRDALNDAIAQARAAREG